MHELSRASILLGTLLWSWAAASAQTREPQSAEPLTIPSLAGKDTFAAYCAPCHGRDGAGGGPVTPVLRVPAADLTRLSARWGFFPRDEVVALVTGTGRSVVAHGTSDMPVWGVVFRLLDPSDSRVKTRLDNVVDYIESFQQR